MRKQFITTMAFGEYKKGAIITPIGMTRSSWLMRGLICEYVAPMAEQVAAPIEPESTDAPVGEPAPEPAPVPEPESAPIIETATAPESETAAIPRKRRRHN